MGGTQNSISSLLAQFMRLEANYLEIISKLSEATTSNADNVAVTQLMDDGTKEISLIPTFGFLKSEIARHDRDIQALAGLGDSSAVIRLPDGTTKQVFSASVLRDPAALSTINVPKTFNVRNNWFFESFLNPLLFITFDVSGKVPDGMEKAVVKRVILNCDTQEKKDYYDLNWKGKNDVDYETFLVDMDANNIDVFFDEDIVDLPLAVVRYTGTFDVVKIWDENISITSNGRTITVPKRKYKLSSLSYTDVLSGATGSKTLKINDVLLTTNGSKYIVDSLDAAENTVVLRRLSGNQPIAIGADVLSIYSTPYNSQEIQVNVGFDERQVIFIKPVEPQFGVAASKFSPGAAIWTNELTISTPAGTQTLEDFYKSQVVDFGLIFMSAAKEKQLPNAFGEVPDAPTLNTANFKVVQINTHKKDTKETDDIKGKLSSKVALENEIKQLEDAINSKKNDLNNNASLKTDAERRKINSDLESLSRDKSSKVNRYSSVVKELSTTVKENPVVIEDAKYRVRGFWPVPSPKQSDRTQPQEVVQFKISYRYIRKDGSAPDATQLTFLDNDGTQKRAYYSTWNEVLTPKRNRVFNTKTGFYEWAKEDVANADLVNFNQLDIPISKGEQVEIKIKSLSEAGWPLNPVESAWSDSVIVDFPTELQISDESSTLLREAQTEETRVRFQEELNSRGLDLHLAKAFTSGDKYYSHVASDVASDFYTPEGKVINLYEKLKSMDDEISRLRQLIEKAKGTLSISIIDSDGNVTKITPNYTAKLFAGFYKDLIKTGSGNWVDYDHGRIITKQYIIRIENSAATPLELTSYMPGGTGIVADDSAASSIQDYATNRKYDLVPLSLSGAFNVPTGSPYNQAPFQSAQVKGLWIYSRYKSVGLDEELYGQTFATSATPTSGYNYRGVLSGTGLLPIDGYHLLPFDPGFNPGTWTTNADVWNGSAPGAGNGYLSEFCIHKNHPEIGGAFSATNTFLAAPLVSQGTSYLMSYPKFVHAIYFNEEASSVNGKKQVQRYAAATPSTPSTNNTHYTPKLGFSNNDQWLIGKYTCGAYLYIAPVDYASIAVDGSTELAKKMLEFGEDKAINIPLVFQFRCSDKLKKIGGYRLDGDISNVTYSKKIGIDIQVRNESLFSFDVEVTCKYEQDSLVGPTYVPNVALDRLDAIRTSGTSSTIGG